MKLGNIFTDEAGNDDSVIWGFNAEGDAISQSLPEYLSTVPTISSAADVSWWQTVANNATEIAKTAAQVYGVYLTANQATQLNDINLQRARTGLPPLSPSQYGPTVNVGLSSDVQKLVIGGVAVIGLVFMLTRPSRK